MGSADDILKEALNIQSQITLNSTIAVVERQLVQRGATHILVCGLPMPGRAVDPLLIHIKWGDVRTDIGSLYSIPSGDPIINRCRDNPAPFLVEGADLPLQSELVASTGYGTAGRLVAFPCHRVPHYQGTVIVMGRQLDFTQTDLIAFDFLIGNMFLRLKSLDTLSDGRPGELSARERSVVALTAFGHTAHEIAGLLDISQRTVHAHLQNAADKLKAANKTQTVVEALRYAQIALADIPAAS